MLICALHLLAFPIFALSVSSCSWNCVFPAVSGDVLLWDPHVGDLIDYQNYFKHGVLLNNDPPLFKVSKKVSRKVSKKVGALRRSRTYRTENVGILTLFPFGFWMFPQVINDLFTKSTLSRSLAAHDTSSSRTITQAACALIPSNAKVAPR